MQRREGTHDSFGAALLEVVLHQVGEFVVQRLELRLVNSHDERREPERGTVVPLAGPDQAAARHLHEGSVRRGHGQTRPCRHRPLALELRAQ